MIMDSKLDGMADYEAVRQVLWLDMLNLEVA